MTISSETIKAQVEIIRSQANNFCVSKAKLIRKTGETVVKGENIVTYADPVDINVRLIVRSGNERTNIAAQERQPKLSTFTGTYRMQIEYGIKVTEGDRIYFVDIENGQERKYRVVYAPPYHEMTGAYVVEVQEIK